MTRAIAILVAAAALNCSVAAAQAVRPRSAAYLYVSDVDDARAVWVNPAGLAIVPDASVMAEIAVDNPPDGSLRVGQWTVGLNSRGFSLGFMQDRLLDGQSVETLRFGLAVGFRGGALGGSVSNYFQEGDNTRSGDVGFMYHLLPSLTVGLALQNIGRPVIVDSVAPVTGVGGLSWVPVAQHLAISLEAHVAEELENSTRQSWFRAGLTASTGGSIPVALIAALDLGSNMKVDALTLGLSVGGNDRGILLGTGVRGEDIELQRFSLSGVAKRRSD